MKRLLGLLFIMLIFPHFLSAQSSKTTSISGFVFDSSNGEALISATAAIKELKAGAITNNSGYFVISGIRPGNYKLTVSYVGYATEVKNIVVKETQEKPLRIELKPQGVSTNAVVVTGESEKPAERLFERPISKIELNALQVNQIPKVIEADLLRALQTLPGIVPLSDFSSALYVRGGTPDQNLYLIDGADVYNPEHAFGIFSTFNTNAIKKVDISKGGFGAEYGGRLSSVLDITNLDGNRNNFEGVFNLSLLSASATLQVPLGTVGSLSGSFRRTYIDQTYAKWIKEVPNYYFYDGNFKGYFDLGERDKLTISYFNSYDMLDYKLDKNSAESFQFLYNWGNTTGSINWKHLFNTKLFTSFWLTASRFESNFSFDQIMKMNEKNLLTDIALKGIVEYYYSNELNLRFGIEHKFLHFLYNFKWDSGLADIDYNRQLSSGYAALSWKPSVFWNIEPSLRVNYFAGSSSILNFEPRFSIKYRLDDESSIKFATGLYHQYLNRVPRLFFASIWSSLDNFTRESQSSHFILGYQRELGSLLEFEAEVYYKNYKNIYIYNQNYNAVVKPTSYDPTGNPIYTTGENLYTRGDGNSYGLEVLIRKNVGALTGWGSYSYSNTHNTFDGINQGKEFIPRHNRSSVINLVLNTDLKSLFSGKWNEAAEISDSKWLLGISFVYASGQPITMPASAYYVNTVPDWGNTTGGDQGLPAYKLYPGSINTFNLPDYIRMDLSLTYEKNYGSWSIAPYLQIFNIGNRQNVWFINYKDKLENKTIKQDVDVIKMLPLLPSIGITIKF